MIFSYILYYFMIFTASGAYDPRGKPLYYVEDYLN